MKPTHARARQVARTALAAVEAERQHIDDLNVYPVPDGDTGSNMAQTMRRVAEDLTDPADELDAASLARHVAQSALVGARGNSGVILSQMIRGGVTALAKHERLDADAVADALRGASDGGYGAVTEPVEGTMLTVLREMAEEADDARRENLHTLLDRVLSRGEKSLAATQYMLDTLRDAGVVDAGGAGVLALMRGITDGIHGRGVSEHPSKQPAAPVGLSETSPGHGDGDSSRYRYCTGFMVTSPDGKLDRDALHRQLAVLGDSLLVVGDEHALRGHVHTDDPGAALTIAVGMGGLSGVEISDMRAQVSERIARLSAPAATSDPVRHRRCDVVCVMAGEGNTRLARELGCRAVVAGGASMNPSTEEILTAIDACAADEVVILPNNANIEMAARSASGLARVPCVVVETTSIPAGLVALESYRPTHSAEDNASAMRAAIAASSTGAVTQASRDARVDGVPVTKGHWMGLVDGQCVASSGRLEEVTARVVSAMLSTERQALTVLEGDTDMTIDTRDNAIAAIADAHPSANIVRHDAGQPHYPFLFVATPRERRLDAATTAIVFDSTADIPADRLTRPSWAMVPLTVRFGQEEYRDGVDLTGKEFYAKLRTAKEMPRTAAPSPGAFEEAYEQLLDRYRDVISLHISGRLSATVESARAASDVFGTRVRVFDTLATTGLLSLAVDEVQRMLDRGTTVQQVEEFVRSIPARGGIAFGVDTLEFLQKNGRIGRGQALLGGFFRVKPILALVNGEVDAVRRVRGRRAMIPAMVETLIRRSAGFSRIDVAILHADCPDDAMTLQRAVKEARGGIITTRTLGIGAVIGAHVGPGALGVAFLGR